MTNLVPEKRMDANGRMVTRWVKPAGISSISIAPAPSLTPSYRSAAMDQMFALIHQNRVPVRSEKKRASLAEMHKLDPNMDELVIRLLTTGTETAKELVRTVIEESLDWVNYTRELNDPGFQWDIRCKTVLGDNLREKLTVLWSAGNVAEETLSPEAAVTIKDNAEYAHQALVMDSADPVPYRVDDPVYWRGMAVLSLVTDVEAEDEAFKAHGMDFVEWVGDRDDLTDVIRLSKERGIIDPSALQDLIEAKGSLHGSLGEGII